MTLQQYALKVIETAQRNENFPDKKSPELYKKLKDYFLACDYEKTGRPKEHYADVMSKHRDILVLTDVFNENSFAIAWNGTDTKLLNKGLEIKLRRPTYSEFITLVLARTYFAHFENDIDGDFTEISRADWNKEFTIAISGEYAIHSANAMHHRN